MKNGNNSAYNRREFARWVKYQRDRAYFEEQASVELRQATALWREHGGQDGDPAERDAALAHLAELFPDNVRFTGTLPELVELVSRGQPRGRPFIYDPAEWPKARARAVASIRRRPAGKNYPSRARIAAALEHVVDEKTVYNYDRALRLPKG